jgi:hypothetical protein
MPKFDKTGPLGRGPLSGQGFGPCGFGLGWRKRFGSGRGMGRYFSWRYPETKEEQIRALDEYKKALQEELEDVESEQKELGKK